MPRSYDQKLKILYILDYLQKNSHEDKPVRAGELIDMLAKKEIRCDRKTVYSDIATLQEFGIDIKVANELLEKRADLYRAINPEATVVCGDITKEDVFSKIIASCPKKVDFILASPPCQGMSVAGKNRNQKTMEADERNYQRCHCNNFVKNTNASQTFRIRRVFCTQSSSPPTSSFEYIISPFSSV